MLRETELTLAGAMKICHASELAQQHAQTFGEHSKEQDGAAVATVSGRTQKYKTLKNKQQNNTEKYMCKRCGSQHAPKKCPAYGNVCNQWKGKNHYAKQCFSKGKQSGGEHVHTIEEALADSFFVGMVKQEDFRHKETEQQMPSMNSVEQDKWIVPLEINGAVIPLKLDTGAKANLMSERDIRVMKVKPHVHPNSVKLNAYNGQQIKTKGMCKPKVKIKEKEHQLMFVVVPDGHDSLLGDKACENLGLVRRVYCINNIAAQHNAESIVDHYADIFYGFGVLPFTYKI